MENEEEDEGNVGGGRCDAVCIDWRFSSELEYFAFSMVVKAFQNSLPLELASLFGWLVSLWLKGKY